MDGYITPPNRSNVCRKRQYNTIISHSFHKKPKLSQYSEYYDDINKEFPEVLE